MTVKRFLIASLLVLIAALTLFAVRGFADRDTNDKGVVGSWKVSVNIAGAPAPFDALITFTEDGSVLETDAARFPMPIANAGPGHGSWIRTGHHQYSFNFVRLLFDTGGNFIGTFEIHSSLSLNKDGDRYNDSFMFAVRDPSGNQLFAGVGTGQGKRITVEPVTGSVPLPDQPPGGGAAGGGDQ